jgi:hypothetical protein
VKVQPPKPDRSKIDLSDERAARAWAKKLGKTKEEITLAIKKVGNSAAAVRKELGLSKPEGA